MGQAAGRVGDIGMGICSAHDSPIPVVVTLVTGVPEIKNEGKDIATLISIGIASCGHTSIVATTSSIANAKGNGIHRVGDTGILPGGTYTLVTGSPNMMVG